MFSLADNLLLSCLGSSQVLTSGPATGCQLKTETAWGGYGEHWRVCVWGEVHGGGRRREVGADGHMGENSQVLGDCGNAGVKVWGNFNNAASNQGSCAP